MATATIRSGVPGVLQARNPVNSGLYAGGTFNVFNLKTNDDSLNVNGELNSSFLDKRLLFDLKIGWHHQLDEGLPGDGSEFNTQQEGTIAGTPGLRHQHRRPPEHRHPRRPGARRR